VLPAVPPIPKAPGTLLLDDQTYHLTKSVKSLAEMSPTY